MPAQYEAIRDSLVKRGKDYDEAQRIAAATYNKHHKKHPMGPHSDEVRKKVVHELMK
jgi:hypothetical protein